jgi:ribosomal protein S12 methylthiotransferase accessory factor
MEEAILHGLMELIERDGFLLAWYAQLMPPRIDPWSSRQQETFYLLDRIDHLGYDIHLLDTRFDIDLPSVTVVVERRDNELGKLMVSASASIDPEAAIRGALCEVAGYIPDMRERVTMMQEELSAMVKDHTRVTQLGHHSLIYGFPEMAQKARFLLQNSTLKSIDEAYGQWYEALPRQMDLLVDLQYCLDMMLQRGLDVIVVDQTAPELTGTGLKVAKVIVPGLIPIDFGWGRNRVFDLPRLRTVPRTSGFMSTDFDLAHLNMTPHPFP